MTPTHHEPTGCDNALQRSLKGLAITAGAVLARRTGCRVTCWNVENGAGEYHLGTLEMENPCAAGPNACSVGEDAIGDVGPLAGAFFPARLSGSDFPAALYGVEGTFGDPLPLREDVQQLVRRCLVDLAAEALSQGGIAECVTDALDGPRLAAHRCLRLKVPFGQTEPYGIDDGINRQLIRPLVAAIVAVNDKNETVRIYQIEYRHRSAWLCPGSDGVPGHSRVRLRVAVGPGLGCVRRHAEHARPRPGSAQA
ncbi:hypothetical protein P8605_10665 [Streptomyces sp. T-3]|nr:hypothetical protein [Streptomyces sp. T-3]